MAFPQGIYFRAADDQVDPTSYDAEVGTTANYPRTTAQGNVVGWEGAPAGTRDRATVGDVRLRGIHFGAQTGTQKYRIDLPAPGTYNIRIAMGDSASSHDARIRFYDNTTLLVDRATTLVGAGQFRDASGVIRTSEGDWATNNVVFTATFASTIFRLDPTGGSTATDPNWAVAALYIESAGGSTTVVSNDLAATYSIVAPVSKDQLASYAINALVSADLAPTYTISAPVSVDLSASYQIAAAAHADLAATYTVYQPVSADLAASYSIGNAVSADLVVSYQIASSITQVSNDLIASYQVREFVNASLAAAYGINAAVQADLTAVYALASQVSADLNVAYDVAQSTTAVNADLACAYLVYSVVNADLTASYSIADTSRQYPLAGLTQARPITGQPSYPLAGQRQRYPLEA